MYYVYVQENVKGQWYKGHTFNLARRRVEHLLQWSPYSKRFGVSFLVYFESFQTRSQAMKREKYFKTGKGRDFLAQYLSSPQHAERYSSG